MKAQARITLIVLIILLGAFMLTMTGCSLKRITKSKNIVYQIANKTSANQQLNVFSPRKHSDPKSVLIFVHGGNWNSGKKSQYNIIGAHWAKKDVVTVIVDYPLSPVADYNDMAISIAKSVKWVKENIRRYGGDPAKIFLSGHSAGGHLAALVALDEHYFKDICLENPLAGLILIDAAGLDMHGYLTEEKFEKGNTYLHTFSNDPNNWKKASPLYHFHQNMPPMLIYRGGKTYPSILTSNDKFIKALQPYAPETPYHIQKSKKHIPMITQFFNPWNARYGEILAFMKAVESRENMPEDKRDEAVGK